MPTGQLERLAPFACRASDVEAGTTQALTDDGLRATWTTSGAFGLQYESEDWVDFPT